MRSLPAGWTVPSNAAVNDDVLVSLPDATWLDGPQVVDSFSIKRELVGSILPGQVRAGSGLSVADGGCSFFYRAADGAPWRVGAAKIEPTGTASLYASGGDLPAVTYRWTGTVGGSTSERLVDGVVTNTNLSVNPGAEVAGGWASNNGALYAVTRDTAFKRSGAQSAKSTTTGAGVVLLSMFAVGGTTNDGVPAAPGVLSHAVYVYSPVAATARLAVAHKVSGSFGSTTNGPTIAVPVATWTLLTLTATAPAGTTFARPSVFLDANVSQSAGTAAWTDDYICETGPTVLTPPFDGSTTATGPSPTIPLGVFDIDGVAAKLSTPTMGLELIDQNVGQRSPNTFPGYLSADETRPVESAWVVDQMARSLGYYSTPAPVASCVLSVPMAGSIVAEVGQFDNGTIPTGWDDAHDTIAPTGGFILNYVTSAVLPSASFFLTTTITGSTTFKFTSAYGSVENVHLRINPALVEISVKNTDAATYAIGYYTAAQDANHPLRVEVECQRLGVAGAWTGFRARARTSATAAWSAWVTDSTASTAAESTFFTMNAFGGVMTGLQVTTASDPLVWAAATASIYPLGSTLSAPTLLGPLDPWAGIQEFCAANLGAAFVDAAGKLIVRDYSWLRGAREVDDALVVDDDLDDLGWETSREDYADRVTVTYRPATITGYVGLEYPTVWAAEEPYRIPAGETINVTIDVENVAPDLIQWQRVGDLSGGFEGWFSRYDARPFRDGAGSAPALGALTFQMVRINTGRILLKITNNTAGVLHTVNAAGEPALTMRAYNVATFENVVTISSGLPEDQARAALAVELGSYIQSDTDARRVLNLIESQTRAPKAAVSQVLVPFDWRRELGDLYNLTHNGTLLDSKVLCVGIDLQGSPGDNKQLLDLVMLGTTMYDFDTAWDAADPSATLGDFDTVWPGATFGDFDLDPLRTT